MTWLRALLFGASLILAPVPASATLRAIVIGVNAYRSVTPLRGAVNDAELVSGAISQVAASVKRLIDGEVTREAVLAALADVLTASQAGDTVFVSYSGHGGRERVGITPDTPTGFREFWVMADFDPNTPEGSERRVLSTEIRDWLVRTRAAGVRVILLADNCFSGKMYRTVGVDVGRIRSIETLTRSGLAPDEELPAKSEAELAPPPPGLVSLAADTADKPVTEFPLPNGGPVHGALSYVFAYALTTGRSELDQRAARNQKGKGLVTAAALESFIQEKVSQLTEGQQSPQLRNGMPAETVLFVLPAPAEPPASADRLLPVPTFVDGMPSAEAQKLVASIPGAVWAPDPARARLIEHYRARGSRVVTGLNMFVHFDLAQSALPAVVQKIRVADGLAHHAMRGRLSIAITRGDGRSAPVYFSPDEITITVRDLPGPNLVVFNLESEGRLRLLYPLAQDAPIAWPSTGVDVFRTRVAPVFGGDHLVAVASARPLSTLAAQLRALDRQTMSEAAFEFVTAALRSDLGAEVAVAALFTADSALRCDLELIRSAAMWSSCLGIRQ